MTGITVSMVSLANCTAAVCYFLCIHLIFDRYRLITWYGTVPVNVLPICSNKLIKLFGYSQPGTFIYGCVITIDWVLAAYAREVGVRRDRAMPGRRAE